MVQDPLGQPQIYTRT